MEPRYQPRRSSADKLFLSIAERTSSYEFEVAGNYEELESAYRLVYGEYVERGYCEGKPTQMHFHHYCVLPESRTFLLLDHPTRRICGTASLIVDSPCGLPMESSFGEHLNSIRAEGRRVAEVTLLSVATDAGEKNRPSLMSFEKLPALFSFFRGIFHYARFQGVTDLVITVNPRHHGLYRSLTFKPIGPPRSYERAHGKPAVPMHLDVVEFCDVRFREQPVQKYFLSEPNLYHSLARPAHWDAGVLERLLNDVRFSKPEESTPFPRETGDLNPELSEAQYSA